LLGTEKYIGKNYLELVHKAKLRVLSQQILQETGTAPPMPDNKNRILF
jgi:hypothetical protein